MIEILQKALSQYGVKEIVGGDHNETILNYFKEIGHDWVQDDETAWCSAFINWLCEKEGYTRSDKLNARSWLHVGHRVEPENVKVGDIVVIWREKPSSWKGHVGIYINEDEDYINILGGNQSNQVRISAYPKKRLLQYRRMTKI